MRRFSAAVTALVMILSLSCAPVFADGGRLYAEYVPRTERGTLFYLALYCDDGISAVKMELDYDAELVEYRSVSAASATSTVGARAENGVVTIVLGDSGCVSGCLCRLTFKMLKAGSAAFSVRMIEGVGGDLSPVSPPPEEHLTLTLGNSSVSVSPGSSHGGSGSNKEKQTSTASSTDDEAIPSVRDLSGTNTALIIGVGVCTGLCAALLVILGFYLGMKVKKKKPAVKNGREEDA